MTRELYLSRRLIACLCGLAALLLACLPATARVGPTSALEAVELPVGNAHVQPFDRMRFWIGESDTFDPEKALSHRAAFEPVTTPWIDFGDQGRPVWLLVQVHNPSERAGEWVIDIQRPFAEELLVAKVESNSVRDALLDVDSRTPFSARPIESQYLVAPLAMDAEETSDILIGMRSSTGSWMPVTFATLERMRTAHMQEARFNWTINGAILALVIAALFMGRLVGWPLALGFAGYAGLSALFVANNEGYLHRFVFTEAMWVYEPLNLILLSGMMLALLQFARSFASLEQGAPRFAQWVKGMQIGLAGLLALSALAWQVDAVRLLVFALVPVVALTYLAIAAHAWRAKVLGAVPFLAGSAAIALTVTVMIGVLLAPGQVPMTIALDYFHATLLFESIAFFIAIVVRMLAMQQDLNRSLQAEVAVTREKLELAQALQESRDRYDKARGAAAAMRARLQSTSHDLQQPLIALRQNLQRLADRDKEAAGKLESALDYLEAVTVSGLADEPLGEDQQAGEKPDEGAESFPVSVVLLNCARMFHGEAERAEVEIRLRTSDAAVHTDPVALMRAVSNLVSNALKHAGATTILLAAQERGDHIAIHVIDNGRGMSETEIAQFGEIAAKGEDSDGHGLGLALVREFVNTPGHDLSIRSRPGRGSCFTLRVPRGR
ncbi:sensor histidine kinase [Erythrobacter sp. GH1-10]|uniref:sensor histidine kinase n=1 Tax=Erythrobacter sp. GH1-10 TaxID=3349334 RepID=UPI003877F65C